MRSNKKQANIEQATAMGFFADNIPASEQDVADVAEASSAERSAHYRLRKRRAISQNPDSQAAKLLNSCMALPEPDLGVTSERVITLRVRCLKKDSQLPVFGEGDVIVGVAKAIKSKRRKKENDVVSDDDDEEEGDDDFLWSDDDDEVDGEEEDEESDEDPDLLMLLGQKPKKKERLRRTCTHTSVFSVCAVYWGTRAYVNMMVDGSGHRSAMEDGRAAAGQNCFVVCRIVKAG